MVLRYEHRGEKKQSRPPRPVPSLSYPCQPLLCALSRSCWKPDSASGGATKSFWSLTHTAPRTCHINLQEPVPHKHKAPPMGQHRRELKEDRLGHCGSRTWGRSFTGNLSVWRRSLWSWEENTSKTNWVMPGRWGRMQALQVPGKTSQSFCQLCPA